MLRNTHNRRDASSGDKTILEVKYSPTGISGGGGEVFIEEASRNRIRKRDIMLGTWNVRSLYRAGSLWEGVVGTGWSWLRIGTGGWRL